MGVTYSLRPRAWGLVSNGHLAPCRLTSHPDSAWQQQYPASRPLLSSPAAPDPAHSGQQWGSPLGSLSSVFYPPPSQLQHLAQVLASSSPTLCDVPAPPASPADVQVPMWEFFAPPSRSTPAKHAAEPSERMGPSQSDTLAQRSEGAKSQASSAQCLAADVQVPMWEFFAPPSRSTPAKHAAEPSERMGPSQSDTLAQRSEGAKSQASSAQCLAVGGFCPAPSECGSWDRPQGCTALGTLGAQERTCLFPLERGPPAALPSCSRPGHGLPCSQEEWGWGAGWSFSLFGVSCGPHSPSPSFDPKKLLGCFSTGQVPVLASGGGDPGLSCSGTAGPRPVLLVTF
ncbi:hypothetical protein TREES_T100018468 [Tupaia chinensis]|uniref:Uncharacterized protein n=1 Tax=Tupaia chinensis TaxID=246437 RepID=L9KYS8_TUPCH|nr:hypothetical protein TREES_T100018468 [Tupaia chinensis]